MKLHIIIEKDEAGYYVAEVQALPGCLSQGKTYEEAILNIKEAIEGWFEVKWNPNNPSTPPDLSKSLFNGQNLKALFRS
jgi:predicted RNase H-like HicB family nuclease